MNCKYCNKECKNKNSLVQHEIRCKENPNRISLICSNGKYSASNHKGSNQFIKGKEEGKNIEVSKETRIKISKITKGRKHSKETKEKLSKLQKQYLNNNPDKIPFLLNHSSNKSYPEKYFEDLFVKENIPLKYHKRIGRYELDFYNEDLMKYIEIDGEQHFSEYMIKHDQERKEYLEKLGWKEMRIRWSEYLQLNLNQRKNIINNIINFLDYGTQT